jgi:hypothetical protein
MNRPDVLRFKPIQLPSVYSTSEIVIKYISHPQGIAHVDKTNGLVPFYNRPLSARDLAGPAHFLTRLVSLSK